MGCSLSKPSVAGDTSDDVLNTCRAKMLGISNAIEHRQGFAEAHSAYIESLRNVAVALRKFAEGEISDLDIEPSPRTSTSTTSAVPESSLVAYRAERAVSPPVLSPPLSGSPAKVSLEHQSPPVKPLSPQLSPIRLPTKQSVFSESSSPLSSPENGSPRGTGSLSDGAAYPSYSERSFYSPKRVYRDDALAAHGTEPKPSLTYTKDSSWFSNVDSFTPPSIPKHLQEQRQMQKRYAHENFHDNESVEEHNGISDSEDTNQQVTCNGVALLNAEDNLERLMPSEVVEKVILDEITDISEVQTEKDDIEHGNVGFVSLEDSGHAPGYNSLDVVPTVNSKETVEIGYKYEDVNTDQDLPVTAVVRHRNMKDVTRQISKLFAKACKSGNDLSIMLETQRTSHVKGIKDSTKSFNAITSYWSQKTSLLMQDVDEDLDITKCGMAGSHISTLERLYAWEKKLLEEVKAGEHLRREFDRKCKQLRDLDGHNGSQYMVDKIKVSLKRLDTQLIVALQSIHVTSVKIQNLTNEELYPQIFELLVGSVNMWRTMLECHKAQETIVLELQSLENSAAGDEITDVHRLATIELIFHLKIWRKTFDDWLRFQRSYVNDLFEWLDQYYKQKETMESRRRLVPSDEDRAPIFCLLKEWKMSLEKLDSRLMVSDSIKNFIIELHSLAKDQIAELKHKKQVNKRTVRLRKLESSGKTLEATITRTRAKREIATQFYLSALQARKDRTLDVLQRCLVTLFKSLASFSEDAYQMYENVKDKAAKSAIAYKKLMQQYEL